MDMNNKAKNQLFFLSFIGSFIAFSLTEVKISSGISLIESEISAGTITRSSMYPRTAIKSGIRSIGLSA
jgi:hypothetical protein